MLSAFTARSLIELKQRDKSKIESILTFGNKLLVGLNTGNLRVYRVNEGSEEWQGDGVARAQPELPARPPAAVEHLREIEKFSRRAIEQLAIIKEANILLCLTDGHVSIHDLQSQNYDLQEQLAKTKGASTFAVTSDIVRDPSTGIPSLVSQLVVAVKRRLLLWSWQDTELSLNAVEITLAAAPRTLTWASCTKIVCGLNSGYVIVDVQSREVSDILGSGSIGTAGGQDDGRFGVVGTAGIGYMGMGSWGPRPLATKLTERELLLSRDVNTLFIDNNGKALDRRPIPWSTGPEAIGFSYPYLLALHGSAKGMLEIRNPKTLSLLQSIPLANASKLHVPQPNVSLAHAGKGFLVASERCIWRMKAENYENQIDQLLEHAQLDEAISLLEMLEDALIENKEQRLREVKMQKAEFLFQERRYRDSIDLFTEVSAPPERVIRLYPEAVAGRTLASEERKEAIKEPESNANGCANEVPHQSPETGKGGESGNADASESAMSENKKDPASSLRQESSRSDSVETSDHININVASRYPETLRSEHSLEGKDLKNAILELYAFLADTRRRLQNYLNPDGTLKESAKLMIIGKKVDITDVLRQFVLRVDPSEDVEFAHKLLEIARLVDTTLFRAYMIERPARAGSLFRISNFCDPNVVNEKLLESGRYEDLVDFFHGKSLHRPALELLRRFGQAKEENHEHPVLRGPKKTVAYLQSLSPNHIDLILEFARWPLLEDPDLGMEIFLADTENAETLPRDKVLSFLEEIDMKLAVQYLEHIIQELNELNPHLHQYLVNLYLKRLKQHGNRNSEGSLAFSNDEEKLQWRRKLESFLQSSRHYSTGKTFNALPKDDPEFYESRAIVLSKMGNHKQALEIYVFKLQDYGKAEEYCTSIYLNPEPHTPTRPTSPERDPVETTTKPIFHTLLSLYLSPPPPHKPNLAPALNLLSKHGSRIPAAYVLDLMPASLPVEELESYFRGRLRAGISSMTESQAVRGLSASQYERTRARLFLGDEMSPANASRNRRVVVSEERVCPVCHKRLGRSVISIFPDNVVVHYGCANRMPQKA